MLGLQDAAAVVITDSGGVQEETSVLGVPCLTLRAATERPVTITEGTNRLVSWPPTSAGILDAVEAALTQGRVPVGAKAPEGWDGHAGVRIVQALTAAMG
jgi:UDP-N-acetylglucosamine 2-epimerase (non-hydrolysing)